MWLYQPLLPAAADLLSTPVTTTGQIKYYNGVTWTLKPVKYWDGATWTTKPLKHWNGTQWITAA